MWKELKGLLETLLWHWKGGTPFVHKKKVGLLEAALVALRRW